MVLAVLRTGDCPIPLLFQGIGQAPAYQFRNRGPAGTTQHAVTDQHQLISSEIAVQPELNAGAHGLEGQLISSEIAVQPELNRNCRKADA